MKVNYIQVRGQLSGLYTVRLITSKLWLSSILTRCHGNRSLNAKNMLSFNSLVEGHHMCKEQTKYFF